MFRADGMCDVRRHAPARRRTTSIALLCSHSRCMHYFAVLCMALSPNIGRQVVAHLKSKAGATGSGGKRFEGVRVMCYDSSGWVKKNFQAKVDKHNNEVRRPASALPSLVQRGSCRRCWRCPFGRVPKFVKQLFCSGPGRSSVWSVEGVP